MNRRNLLTGLISFVAAPAIVRCGSLMPVKSYDFLDFDPMHFEVPKWIELQTIVLPTGVSFQEVIEGGKYSVGL